MSCGRISVKGGAEEIAVSPRHRSRQKHGMRSNPFSTQGLDKFESVYAELSAKREYIAKKTGAPEALVRFVYSKNGWIPVVVRLGEENGKQNGGAGTSRASILEPVEKNDGEDREFKRKYERNDTIGGSESISISGFDERSHSMVMPWSLFQFLKIRAFEFLVLSAMWVRKSGVSAAAAMTVVMAVGSVMRKMFILSGVSYFTTLFRNPRNPKSSENGREVEEIAEKKDVYKLSRRTLMSGVRVSGSSRPLRAYVQPIKFSASASPKPKNIDPEHKHNQSNKFRRVVSMGNRPTRTAIPQSSEGLYKRTSPAIANDGSVGATVMIITLLCLVFYGRLYAIFFTSALWYLLPVLVEQRIKWMNNNNNSRMVDLESNEYKMKVIMDGLQERKHN